MRVCDVAVLGLGVMGSAALHALARKGVDVLGFDPLVLGEARGSSHGSCRIYRRFNFESPAYTALSDQALTGWRSLEAESGRTLLMPSPVLEAGPKGSTVVSASRAAAEATLGPVRGPRTGAEANATFPAFDLPDDWDVVVQDSGGILLIEAAVHAFRARASGRITQQAARLEPAPAGLRIVTADDEVLAGQVIVAAGPWLGDLVPAVKPLLSITRQTVGWFRPARPATTGLGDFPVFMLDGPHGFIYGFPDFEGRGVKAARHDHGPAVRPDAWGGAVGETELDAVRTTLGRFIPGAAGPVTETDVCLYTNTRRADLRADQGEEFVIDRLPGDPRVIVASPCSGHGAKFASAIGEILADLATDPAFRADPAFRLDRFSGFAG